MPSGAGVSGRAQRTIYDQIAVRWRELCWSSRGETTHSAPKVVGKGLVPDDGARRSVVAVYEEHGGMREESQLLVQLLNQMWKDKSPLAAHERLSKADIIVTNAKDKVIQLKKLRQLHMAAHGACTSGQHEDKQLSA